MLEGDDYMGKIWGKKGIMLAIGMMLVISTFVAGIGSMSAQGDGDYSDSITDDEDDVSYWYVSDGSYGWRENVEWPDIDIISASIEESDGNISVELEVKGTIQSQEDSDSYFWYSISLEDEDGQSYSVAYYFGQIQLNWPEGSEYGFTEPSGFGTSIFEVSFSLERVGNPGFLEITSVETYEYLEEAGTGEYYHDTAGPEADDPVNGDETNGEDENGDTDFDEEDEVDPEGVLDDLVARGMMCLAIAIIVPIVIIVIIIVVIIKLLSSDDEGGQQPSQQGPPPGQQQPPQQQQPPSSDDRSGPGKRSPPPGGQ